MIGTLKDNSITGGAIVNGSITSSQLDPGLREILDKASTKPGEWQPLSSYATDETVVSPIGIIQKRITSGMSTSVWQDDASNWRTNDRTRWFNVLDYGAYGDDTGDSTAAIQAAMSAAGSVGGVVVIPQGIYRVSATINMPRTVSLDMAGATLKAIVAIGGSILEIGDETGWWRNKFISGGRIDCNNLADKGIFVRRGYASKLDHVTVANAKSVWIQLGDPSSTVSCHELHLIACKGESDYAAPVGSYGLWATSRCADCVFTDVIMVGAEVCFMTEGGRNTHMASHGWGGWAAQLPHTIFKDNGSKNSYMNCYADTPTTYGWWFTSNAWQWSIIGGYAYNHENGIDNTAISVHTDLTNTNGAVIIGLMTVGASASYRWASDYDGSMSSQNIKVVGCQSYNTVLTNLLLDVLRSVNALRIRNTGTAPSIVNGAATGTSPPGATLISWSRDAAGQIRLGTGTSTSAGVLCELTFNVPFSLKPFIVITPASASAANLGLYVDDAASTTTKLVIRCTNAPTVSLAAGSILINYRTDTTG